MATPPITVSAKAGSSYLTGGVLTTRFGLYPVRLMRQKMPRNWNRPLEEYRPVPPKD
jgi:hypothetical protein